MQTQHRQSWVDRLSQVEGEECLANLHRLADELTSAMDAIVQRRLSSLHDCLHLQQVSCGRLASLRYIAEERLRQSFESEAACVDRDLALQIQAATQSVLVLTDGYSALLKHSGDTLQLLAGLYRSYSGFTRLASANTAALPNWYYEV